MIRSSKGSMDYSSAKVLCSLCKDSSHTPDEIASSVGLGPSTVRAKTRNLFVPSFMRTTAIIDPSVFSNVTIALVGIILKFRELSKSLRNISSINEACWSFSVTSKYDIIAQVVSLKGVRGLREFIDNSLTTVGNIDNSQTWIVFNAGTSFVSLPDGVLDRISSKELSLEFL